jgi:hypothetical protein
MATKLGLSARLYYNSNTYASPTWVLVSRIKDVTLNSEVGEADVSTRAGGGYREVVPTLLDANVSFSMLQAPSGTDTVFEAFRSAHHNRTPIEVLVLDGDRTTTGSQGLRATMTVSSFTRNENLEEAIMYDVTIRPTPADNAPAWVTI